MVRSYPRIRVRFRHLTVRGEVEPFLRSLFTSIEERPVCKAPAAVDIGTRKQVSSGVLGDSYHYPFVHRNILTDVLNKFSFPTIRFLLIAAEGQQPDCRSPRSRPFDLVIPLKLVAKCPGIGRRIDVRQDARDLARSPRRQRSVLFVDHTFHRSLLCGPAHAPISPGAT